MSGFSEAEASERLGRLLAPAASQFGVELSASLRRSLAKYALLLLAWNQRINLSGARDLDTLALEHFADAFALMPHLPKAGRCVDVGSGAGLPGLVLALLRPDLAFQLLEPSQKRRAFLAAVVRELELANVAISGERLAEHAAASGARYDFAVARAVFPLGDWLRDGAQLVCAGGVVAGLAGSSVEGTPAGCELYPYDVGAGARLVVLIRR